MSSKAASASGPASPSSRQTPALGPHSPADSPAGRHLSWDQLGPEFCPLANENNKHNDLKIYTTQQEQLWEVYSNTRKQELQEQEKSQPSLTPTRTRKQNPKEREKDQSKTNKKKTEKINATTLVLQKDK